MINVNGLTQGFLTRRYVQYALKKQKRSAVIDLSSFAAELPPMGNCIYCSTKIYNKYLSQSLHEEYGLNK